MTWFFAVVNYLKILIPKKNAQQRRLNPRGTGAAFSLWQPVQLSLDNPNQ
jgi:cytochrome b